MPIKQQYCTIHNFFYSHQPVGVFKDHATNNNDNIVHNN